MNPIAKEIFRAYDIRGIVETALTPETVFAIGQALAIKLKQLNQEWLIIGRDCRLSGPMLFEALSSGVRYQGIHVLDIGQVPTPLMYFATHHLNIPSGIVITGSHNPPAYNGLKIVMNHVALWGESIQEIYHIIQSPSEAQPETQSNPWLTFQACKENSSTLDGKIKQQDITSDYLNYICNTVNFSRALKIVVDSGNGVTGEIAPHLYQRLGAEVIPIFCEIDGRFPNHHPDPGQPKNLIDLQKKVVAEKADLGLAFDGDGDRLGVVDSEGNIIWPDRQLILFAQDILSRNPGASILYDVKCSRHVTAEIEKAKGNPVMYKTGHSLIKAKMREIGALLGGEMSGHLFFKERWFGFDDALYAGARLLELFSKEKPGCSSKRWFDKVPNSENTPELQLAISEQEKFPIMEKLIQMAQFEDARVSTIDGLRVDFNDGFGLVRPSNTSAYLILRFEGDTKKALSRIQEQFRALLSNLLPNQPLPF